MVVCRASDGNRTHDSKQVVVTEDTLTSVETGQVVQAENISTEEIAVGGLYPVSFQGRDFIYGRKGL